MGIDGRGEVVAMPGTPGPRNVSTCSLLSPVEAKSLPCPAHLELTSVGDDRLGMQ